MQERWYKVAELTFKVILPNEADALALLPSFMPFVSLPEETPTFVFDASGEFTKPDSLKKLLAEENDMGRTEIFSANGDFFLTFNLNGKSHIMLISQAYTRAQAEVDWTDEDLGLILTSMLRTIFSQNVILHDGISLHSSTVILDGQGFMFMGKSGTGKSTHSRLWMATFPGTELLNDDNPVVRMIGEKAYVFGTPWSGKTPCYRNLSVPLRGIVRLSQAKENRFERLEDVAAFVEIYKGCSVLRADESLHDRLCDNLTAVIDSVVVGHMDCLPDKDAARLCHSNLTEE